MLDTYKLDFEEKIRTAIRGAKDLAEVYTRVSSIPGLQRVTVNHAVYPEGSYVIGYLVSGQKEKKFLTSSTKESVH